jgi:hypothetical protein
MQSLMSTLNDAADGVLGFLGDLTDFGDYGHERVTKTRIRRVLGYIAKWEAKLKSADSDREKRRAERKLAYYKRQLREMRAELKKDTERREGKGKDWRYDKTRATMLGLDKKDKKDKKVDTAEEAYTAAGKKVPRGLNKAIFLGRIKAALPALNAGLAKGLGYRVAAMNAVNQTIPSSLINYRSPVFDHLVKYEKAYAGKTGFQPASSALLATGQLAQIKANRDRQYQQMTAIRARMLQAQRARAAAASAAEQQRLSALQAQYQQQLAQMQAQYQQLQAAYTQQAQVAQVPVLPPPTLPAAPQPQERSGAFQPFPYSTSLEAQTQAPADEGTEAEGSEGAEGAEDAEDAEDADVGAGEESGETPFYKNPAFVVGALVIGVIAYNQINKKKGKGQGQSTP